MDYGQWNFSINLMKDMSFWSFPSRLRESYNGLKETYFLFKIIKDQFSICCFLCQDCRSGSSPKTGAHFKLCRLKLANVLDWSCERCHFNHKCHAVSSCQSFVMRKVNVKIIFYFCWQEHEFREEMCVVLHFPRLFFHKFVFSTQVRHLSNFCLDVRSGLWSSSIVRGSKKSEVNLIRKWFMQKLWLAVF